MHSAVKVYQTNLYSHLTKSRGRNPRYLFTFYSKHYFEMKQNRVKKGTQFDISRQQYFCNDQGLRLERPLLWCLVYFI